MINPLLFILALIAGFALSWWLIVKRVDREVPIYETVKKPATQPAAKAADAPAAGLSTAAAVAGGAAVAAPLVGASVGAAARSDDLDARLRAAEVNLTGVRDGEWTARLREADPLLAGVSGVSATTAVGGAGVVGAGVAAAAAAAVAHPPKVEEPELAASVDAPADGSSPAGYTVKGDQKARLYLLGSDPDFERARPDVWFRDEDAAREAGYSHYLRRALKQPVVAEPVVAEPVVAEPVVAEPVVEEPVVAAASVVAAGSVPAVVAEASSAADAVEAEVPEVELPEVALPQVELREVALPDVDMPEVALPDVDMPEVALPDVDMPEVALPDVDMPEVALPQVELPEVALPQVEAPEATLPDVEAPEPVVAEAVVSLPEVEEPHQEPLIPESSLAPAALVATGSAVAAGKVGVEEAEYGPGSALPHADGTGPTGWTIKGNADSMLFHTTDSPWYTRTKAEVWFNEEDTARTAGFTRWNERDKTTTAPATLLAKADTPAEPAYEEAEYGPGSARPHADGTGPTGWTIKGNADSMLFHTTDSPWYTRTKAEVWFNEEDTARTAGFTRWNERDKNTSAPATLVETIEEAEYGPGSAKPHADGTGPTGWTIKGNADSMLFHTTASPSYKVTKAEVWFVSEEVAQAAGFKPWDWRRRQ